MHRTNKAAVLPIVCLLSFLSFCLIAYWVSERKVARFDEAVAAFVQSFETPPLTAIMKLFTFIGSTPVVVVLTLAVLAFLYRVLHHRRELVLFVVVIAGSAAANYVLKAIFHRERPSVHRLIEETGYSFPSGHSMGAFSMYATIAFLVWKHIPTRAGRIWTIIACSFMILMIGTSRIYLGVHYPSDVIGSYLASGCWFTLAVWCFQWYQEKRYRRKER
jgi:undecaprenyl-diphosphatase